MGRIRGILLSAAGSFGLGLILCRIWNLPAQSVGVFLLAGIMGASAGAFATGRDTKIGMAAMIPAALASAFPAIWLLGGYLKPLVTVGICLLTLGALTASGYGFYGPLGVWSTLAAGLSLFAARAYGSAWEMSACITAVSALLLTLDGFRDSSMRISQHKNRSYRNIGNPAKIQQHSLILVLIFLGIAVAVTLVFWSLKTAAAAGVRALINSGSPVVEEYMTWLKAVMAAFQAWLRSILHTRSGEGNGGGDNSRDDGWARLNYVGSAVSTMVMVACFIAACVLVTLCIGGLFLRNRMKTKKAEEIVDYEDYVEKLERPGLLRRWRDRKNKQKIRDFESPAMKIRYIFQQMLRKKAREDGTAIIKTPNELLDPSVSDEDILVATYNRVKYGNRDVTPEELEVAERYFKNL